VIRTRRLPAFLGHRDQPANEGLRLPHPQLNTTTMMVAALTVAAVAGVAAVMAVVTLLLLKIASGITTGQVATVSADSYHQCQAEVLALPSPHAGPRAPPSSHSCWVWQRRSQYPLPPLLCFG
jgi:hypothetical protein